MLAEIISFFGVVAGRLARLGLTGESKLWSLRF
jgi:hypothetical protein